MTHETSMRPGKAPQGAAARLPWPRRERRGLIGMMLSVVLVGVILVVALAVFARVNASMNTQTVQTTVSALESEIRRSFANARTYTNEDYHDFLAVRMPENAIRGAEGAEDIITPWGGEVTAGGGTTIGTSAASANRFWIRIAGLPREACITLAESFLDRSTVVEVRIGDAAPGVAHDNRADIETACNGGDNDGVGIVYRG